MVMDRSSIKVNYALDGLESMTLVIGYQINSCPKSCKEFDIDVLYVRSEDGQDVESLFDRELMHNECVNALEL
jgi:hypothetical protein